MPTIEALRDQALAAVEALRVEAERVTGVPWRMLTRTANHDIRTIAERAIVYRDTEASNAD